MILSKKTIQVFDAACTVEIAEEFALWTKFSTHLDPDPDYKEAFEDLDKELEGDLSLILRAALDISENKYTETSNKIEITLNSGK